MSKYIGKKLLCYLLGHKMIQEAFCDPLSSSRRASTEAERENEKMQWSPPRLTKSFQKLFVHRSLHVCNFESAVQSGSVSVPAATAPIAGTERVGRPVLGRAIAARDADQGDR